MANTEQRKKGEAVFLGDLLSFRNSLKLNHWSIAGKGSYETHISWDQAIDSLVEITDRLLETTFALEGTLNVVQVEDLRTTTPLGLHILDFSTPVTGSLFVVPPARFLDNLPAAVEAAHGLLDRPAGTKL